MWLLSVVAPANVRAQKPHRYGLSLTCVSTCIRSCSGLAKEHVQCPHWYGLSGCWGQTCICNVTRWVNVFKHCLQRHEVLKSLVMFGLVGMLGSSVVGVCSFQSGHIPEDSFLVLLKFFSRDCGLMNVDKGEGSELRGGGGLYSFELATGHWRDFVVNVLFGL